MSLRKLLPLLSILFIFFISTLQADAKESYPFVGVVNEERVNVRAGQSFNFERLCRLSKDTRVLVVDKNYSWYKIVLPSEAKIYLHSKFITLLNENEGKVNANRVNVRAGPGISHTVLGQLNTGDKVGIIKKEDDWYALHPTDSVHGWISEKYVNFESRNVAQLKKELTLARKIFSKPLVVKEEKKPQEVVKKEVVKQQPKVEVKKQEVQKQEVKKPEVAKPKEVPAPAKVVKAKAPKKVVKEKPKKQPKPVAKKPKVPATPKVVQAKKPAKKFKKVSLSGYIQPASSEPNSSIYNLVIDDEPAFVINGVSQIVNDFLYYTVAVEGKVQTNATSGADQLPTLNVSSVQLVL